MLEELTARDFEALVGARFVLAAEPGLPSLALTEVQAFDAQPQAPRPEPFSLVFTSDEGRQLSQKIHPLEHPAFGRLELFLVPIGPGPDGLPRYEAVFN